MCLLLIEHVGERRHVAVPAVPTPILQELPPEKRRSNYLFERGNWLVKGKAVKEAVPAILGSLPEEFPPNRLAMAKWLVSPENPLTARVAVNRFWQLIFGTGIVKTSEDFGSQGEWPSNPALLDHLAWKFMNEGWDSKKLMKYMVMSSAYRQSSKISDKALKIDPYNRLISRGPRFRLDAEMLRDSALAVSGLMVSKIGGASVKPYQPAGIWKELANQKSFRRHSN